MTAIPWTRYLSYARESAYGDGASATQHVDIQGESLSLRAERDALESPRTGSAQRKSRGHEMADGSVEALVDFTSAGHWLSHLMGTPTTTNPAATAQQHVWTHNSKYRPGSLCLYTYPDRRIHKWPGTLVNSLKIQSQRAAHLVFSLGVQAKVEEDGGSIPSVDESSFSGQVAPGTADETFAIALVIDGNSRPGVGSLSLDFDWERELRVVPRFRNPVGIIPGGKVMVKGKLSWRYDSAGEYRHDAYLEDSTVAIAATWTGANISGLYDYALAIELPNCFIQREQPPSTKGSGGPSSLTHSIDFVALASSSLGGSPFRFTLVNETATPASF